MTWEGWTAARVWSSATVAVAVALVTGVRFADAQSVTVNKLPILVDGSRAPDKIPADLAYRHFIRAIAEHLQPLPIELARRNAHLARLA